MKRLPAYEPPRKPLSNVWKEIFRLWGKSCATGLIVRGLIVHEAGIMHRMKKNPILIALGKNVSELRNQKGLTQEQLAERSGLDPSYISGIERGVRNPSILSLVRLANGFESSVADICAGLGKKIK